MKDHLVLRLLRLRDDLGLAGVASLALVVFAALFHVLVVDPAQQRNDALELEIAKHAGRPAAAASGAGEKLAALYDFLRRSEAPTDWLAKLYGIATATGVELQSASYRMEPGAGGARVEHYEITLPISGSYGQIRDFVQRALAEIPILSIDRMSLKRDEKGAAVQAELRLTLHLVKA